MIEATKLNVGWGYEVKCDLHTITNEEILEIGKLLKYNQVVVIKGHPNLDPKVLQRLCHGCGDMEGYSNKVNLYDDPNTPENMAHWANTIESPSTRQRYIDYCTAPGVMRVTGKLTPDGRRTGFFGDKEDLDWHCNKPSNEKRHSYVSLYSVEGSVGSQTSWLDTSKAWNDLSDDKRDFYKKLGLTIGHKIGRFSHDPSFIDHINDRKLWPLVLDKYGKTGMFFPMYQVFGMGLLKEDEVNSIEGWEDEWGWLRQHVLKEEYMYHHFWEDGDLVMSDQDITLHKRWEFDKMEDRLMWRIAHGVDNVKD